MKTLLKNPKQIVTVNSNGAGYKRGLEMNSIEIMTDHSIVIIDSKIDSFIETESINVNSYDKIIDVSNKVVLPGLIECHTHSVFSGSRSNEFIMRLQGSNYEEIAKQGGGIVSTVETVRKSSFEDLIEISKPRIENFISQGITTLEIKSGYGLSFYDEIKMLQVIKQLGKIYKIDIIPTFLGAHTFPPEYKNDNEKYIELIVKEMLPYISEHELALFCDGFCETSAFSSKHISRIFDASIKLGLNLKLHTEQFNTIGGLELALDYNATSVDHLEVLKYEQIDRLCASETTAVLLPGVSFFLNYSYAPARTLIDKGAIVAIATDFNPGSSNISNLHLIMSLAAIKMKMTIEEIITAVTLNAANALDISKTVGSIEIGKSADFSIFDAEDFSEIVYNIGNNLNSITIKNGEILYSKE